MNITVDILRKAGCSAELIVRILEIADEDRTSRNRENNRIRQRNHRARNDVTRYARDRRDTPPGNIPPPKEKPKKVSLTAHRLPDDFALTDGDHEFAQKRGWDEWRRKDEFQRFTDHAQATGRKLTDWHAGWRTWVMSPYNNTTKNGAAYNGRQQQKPPGLVAACDDLLDELRFQRGQDRSPDDSGKAVVLSIQNRRGS